MRKLFILLLISILVHGCATGQTKNGAGKLSATEFSRKIDELSTELILDVRSPGEFSTGHLQNAINWDWNGSDFDKQLSTLDKSKPVFVYCQAGGRSSSAADKMRSVGFKQVYEMEGGIRKWREANLPEAELPAQRNKNE